MRDGSKVTSCLLSRADGASLQHRAPAIRPDTMSTSLTDAASRSFRSSNASAMASQSCPSVYVWLATRPCLIACTTASPTASFTRTGQFGVYGLGEPPSDTSILLQVELDILGPVRAEVEQASSREMLLHSAASTVSLTYLNLRRPFSCGTSTPRRSPRTASPSYQQLLLRSCCPHCATSW